MANRNAEFEALLSEADAAGNAAAEAAVPVPMNVKNMHTDEVWHVPDGACGFAWVVVKPGNCPLANWLKKEGNGDFDNSARWSKHYHGGVSNWVGGFNQSVARKEAYARAFAKVLEAAGHKAFAGSRLD